MFLRFLGDFVGCNPEFTCIFQEKEAGFAALEVAELLLLGELVDTRIVGLGKSRVFVGEHRRLEEAEGL